MSLENLFLAELGLHHSPDCLGLLILKELILTSVLQIDFYPIHTRRRFNVDTTSYDIVRRRIDVERRRVSTEYEKCYRISEAYSKPVKILG